MFLTFLFVIHFSFFIMVALPRGQIVHDAESGFPPEEVVEAHPRVSSLLGASI